MDVAHQLTVVAFVRSTGGRVRVLLAVDRAGVQLFDGEPAVLVEHRPGAPADSLSVSCAERIPDRINDHIAREAGDALASLIESAFDDVGTFDGSRMLGVSIEIVAPHASFDA